MRNAARAAAQTVCDFAAAGHQVLVFTCHDHIRDVFRSLGVDIRCLPAPEEVAESGRPVLPESLDRHPLPPEPPVAPPPPAPIPEVVPEPPRVVSPPVPSQYDPELDFELLYGAPEYDPGYEPFPTAPVPAAVSDTDGADEAYLAGYRDGLRESGAWQAWDRPLHPLTPPPLTHRSNRTPNTTTGLRWMLHRGAAPSPVGREAFEVLCFQEV